MAHEEYLHIVPGAKTAVLFLHGIVGSPEHFRKLIDLQDRVPGDCSVHNVCYPGHGGKVTDFGSSRLKRWRVHAEKAFDALSSTHEQVVVVGHSMGTLFAMQLAMAHPEKVPCIFLLQSPMYVGLRWFGVKNLIRIPFGKISGQDPYGASMLVACGVQPSPYIWLYTPWIMRMLELFREIWDTRKRLDTLLVRTLAFQSQRDELVSNRSSKLLHTSSRVEVTELPDSTHFYYAPEDRQKILDAFDAMLKDYK